MCIRDSSNSKHWFTTSFLDFGGRCRKAMFGVWGELCVVWSCYRGPQFSPLHSPRYPSTLIFCYLWHVHMGHKKSRGILSWCSQIHVSGMSVFTLCVWRLLKQRTSPRDECDVTLLLWRDRRKMRQQSLKPELQTACTYAFWAQISVSYNSLFSCAVTSDRES